MKIYISEHRSTSITTWNCTFLIFVVDREARKRDTTIVGANNNLKGTNLLWNQIEQSNIEQQQQFNNTLYFFLHNKNIQHKIIGKNLSSLQIKNQ